MSLARSLAPLMLRRCERNGAINIRANHVTTDVKILRAVDKYRLRARKYPRHEKNSTITSRRECRCVPCEAVTRCYGRLRRPFLRRVLGEERAVSRRRALFRSVRRLSPIRSRPFETPVGCTTTGVKEHSRDSSRKPRA